MSVSISWFERERESERQEEKEKDRKKGETESRREKPDSKQECDRGRYEGFGVKDANLDAR